MKRKVEMVTTVDYQRLSALLNDAPRHEGALAVLDEKLGRAAVVDPAKAPGDLITMNSTIVGTVADDPDAPADDRRTLTLVYPRAANIGEGRISVCATLGAELLGMHAGQVVTWKGFDGVARKMTIERLIYQPEASGDWHL